MRGVKESFNAPIIDLYRSACGYRVEISGRDGRRKFALVVTDGCVAITKDGAR